MGKIMGALALIGAGAIASGANATVLDFDYTTTAGTSISADFQITIADTANPLGGYTITSVSGTVDGQSVALTPYVETFPLSFVGQYAFNDTVYKIGGGYFLSISGMLVETASGYYNFGEAGIADYALKSATPTSRPRRSVGSYTLSLAASPAPEPAVWAMFVIGFGVLGLGMRRGQQSIVRFG